MNYRLDKTINTPGIIIEPGRVDIRGKAIPENAFDFFLPVIDLLTTYFQEDYPSTCIVIYLEYINSSSKKFIKSIFQLFEKAYVRNPSILVHWYYDEDDESVYDFGLYLQATFRLPIKIEEML